MRFRVNNNGGSKQAYAVMDILGMWDPVFAAILPFLQECSYLHYHSAYGHQIWQGGNLHEGLVPIKSQDSLIT